MKKVLMLMLGLVATTASFAHQPTATPETAQARVTMTAAHKIKLYIQPIQTKGQVVILDADGQAIYTQHVALGKGISQQFDISGLGNGTFRLMLTTGSETLTRTFVVQANPNESFVVQ